VLNMCCAIILSSLEAGLAEYYSSWYSTFDGCQKGIELMAGTSI